MTARGFASALFLSLATTAQALAAGFDCQTIVPPYVRAMIAPDLAVEGEQVDERRVWCAWERGENTALEVSVDCRPTSTLARFEGEAKALIADHRDFADIVGLGLAAVGSKRDVRFYDDDADCAVTVSNYVNDDTVTVARGIAKALRAANLPPIAREEHHLPCERLFPKALRDERLGGAAVRADWLAPNAASCAWDHADRSTASVTYICSERFDNDALDAFAAEFTAKGLTAEKVAVGKSGVFIDLYGHWVVLFLDAQTGCIVRLVDNVGEQKDALAFARALEKALTPAAIR